MSPETLAYRVGVALSGLERHQMLANLEQPGTNEGTAVAAAITYAVMRGQGSQWFGSFQPRWNLVRKWRRA